MHRTQGLALILQLLHADPLIPNADRVYESCFLPLQVGTMFAVLERIAAADPKHAPVLLLENYAAFQNR
jgi:hypothetical protein